MTTTTTTAAVATHDTGPRRSVAYPVTPAPHDPERLGGDITTSWPMIVAILLLVPPLGALQLSHRTDVPGRLRLAIAGLALVVVVLSWVDGLQVLT